MVTSFENGRRREEGAVMSVMDAESDFDGDHDGTALASFCAGLNFHFGTALIAL